MSSPTYDGKPETYRSLIENGYDFNLGKYVNRGWEIFKPHLGSFFGFSFVAYMIAAVASFVPLLGGFVSIAMQGILYAGFFIVAHRIVRGQSIEFGDFFKGFDDYLQLGLAQIVMVLIMIVPALIMGIIAAVVFGVGSTILEGMDSYEMVLAPGIIATALLILLPIMYLAVSYSFTLPLIVLGRLEFWPAMETSRKIITQRWWSFFGMFLLFALFYMVGIFMFIIGVFAAMALVYCIQYAAYEDIVLKAQSLDDHRIDEIGIEVEEVRNFDDI